MAKKDYLSLIGVKALKTNLQNWVTSKFVNKDITINNKKLNSNITLTASDVGADANGSASTALADAKTYTDSEIIEWIGNEKVSAQITKAVSQKSNVQFIIWGADD